MPPKKTRPANNNNATNDNESANEDNDEDNSVPQTEPRADDVTARTEYLPRWHSGHIWNFVHFRNTLQAHEATQDDLRTRLPGLIRQHIRLLQAGNAATLRTWLGGPGKEVTSDARDRERLEWVKLQGQLEDFLYYQNSEYRWKRLRDLTPEGASTSKEDLDAEYRTKKPWPYYLSGMEPKRLVSILDRFDAFRTGSASHSSGETDANGKDLRRTAVELEAHRIPPNELRLWVPNPRRPWGGVRLKQKKLNDYNPRPDYEALEERRVAVEDRANTTQGVRYRNHRERRAEELKTCKKHPATSDQNRFYGMRTDQGLFISALENSRDWRTSYDCLGWVKSGEWTDFEISAVRETAHYENPDDDDQEIIIMLEQGRGKKGNEDVPNRPSEPPTKEPRTGKKRGRDPEEPEEGPAPKKRKGKEGVANDADEEENTDEEFEFTRNSRTFNFRYAETDQRGIGHMLEPSEWAEETIGRREWHVHMKLPPYSPVDSPPHSPMTGAIPMESIPDQFEDDLIVPIMPVTRRRCRTDPERCRAWWNHDPSECFVVESIPARATGTAIPEPEMFRLPNGGVGAYDARAHDHYGLNGEGEAKWPKLGIRMPYEPMTFDDLKPAATEEETADEDNEMNEDPQPAGKNNENAPKVSAAKKAPLLVAHEVHALAMPIVTEPHIPWGEAPPEPTPSPPSDPGDGDEESEDEGDLFRNSYIEASRPSASTAPPPGNDDDGDAPGDTADNAIVIGGGGA